MIIGQSDRVTASVETFQDLGQGADCGSARDELFHPIPWRSHIDQPQLRNLEKLYTQDSNYTANIANEGCVGVRQYNIIQDCLQYGWGLHAHLNDLPDFWKCLKSDPEELIT
jgi:hypothetical protein